MLSDTESIEMMKQNNIEMEAPNNYDVKKIESFLSMTCLSNIKAVWSCMVKISGK